MAGVIVNIINFFKIYVVLGVAIHMKYGQEHFANYLFAVAGLWCLISVVDWVKK